MLAEMKTIKHVTLQLTEEEAQWLKSIVQNPINIDPEKEDEYNSEMRHKFWVALKSCGV